MLTLVGCSSIFIRRYKLSLLFIGRNPNILCLSSSPFLQVMVGLPLLEGINPASCFPRTAIGYEATCYSHIWSEVVLILALICLLDKFVIHGCAHKSLIDYVTCFLFPPFTTSISFYMALFSLETLSFELFILLLITLLL